MHLIPDLPKSGVARLAGTLESLNITLVHLLVVSFEMLSSYVLECDLHCVFNC